MTQTHPPLTRNDVARAVEYLDRHERGRRALSHLLALLDSGALSLDREGQAAALTLLRAAWGDYPASTRDFMRDALEQEASPCS